MQVEGSINMINLQIHYHYDISPVILIVSVLFRLGAAIFFYRITKRALILVGIKNGLIMLRKMLLLSSTVMFGVTLISIILTIIRPFVNPLFFTLSTDALSFINGLGFLFLGFIQYKIQSFQYSPRQLDLHSKIAALEKKEDIQIENREIARIKVNAERRKQTKKKNNNKN